MDNATTDWGYRDMEYKIWEMKEAIAIISRNNKQQKSCAVRIFDKSQFRGKMMEKSRIYRSFKIFMKFLGIVLQLRIS